MNFLLEKQNRNHLLFLSGFCILLISLAVFSGYLQMRGSREILLEREASIASALLSRGTAPGTIAAAFSQEEVTKEGMEFLGRIGHTEQTALWLLPVIRKKAYFTILSTGFWSAGLSGLLLFASVWYMKNRERLYREAADMVFRFAEGDFSAHLPRNQSGTIYRLFASIDQLAIALQTKREAEHRAKEFLKDTVSDISHQLKTPLAALQMYTEIIAAEPDHPETVRTFSGKSMRSLARMEELIQSLLKITRLDAGSIQFDRKETSVADLLSRALESLLTRAKQEQKQVIVDGGLNETVVCDPEWTGEAIGNLIKNALDHTETGGTIRIFWERSSAMLRLSVEDDGCGIAPEDIHHIFKRFYRSSHCGDRQGVGLGLPLAKTIIEGQGGILSVTSTVGKGSVFHISFFTAPFLTES